MITSLTPFSSVVAGFPQFIEETNADWEMATDYILSQVSALSISEWAIVEKIYDETIDNINNWILMKKYIYLVCYDAGYDGHYVDEDESKAFESLDDAQSYCDYRNEPLKQRKVFCSQNQYIITKVSLSWKSISIWFTLASIMKVTM